MQDIYISDAGKGFPLVLVHGFLGSSKMWEPQINFFKKYFRTITLDLPGFGKSNSIKSQNNITSMANLILQSLEKKKIKKFHLMGHSMGGMIVQEMAKECGEKIDKLICYSTGSMGEMPGRFETIEQSRENLKNTGLDTTVENITKTWFLLGEKAKYYNICIQSGKETSLEAADNALSAMKKWNGIKNLKLIKNKTLIIWGDKDKSYNFEQVKKLEENILNSTLQIFEECAHNVHLEKTEKFNKTVLNFLNNSLI